MRIKMLKSEKGFSLIELLITIAIAGALTAIAILYTPGVVTGYKVRGATRLIYSDMQMARLKAIKEGKIFAVEFITGNTVTYCVKRRVGANWDAGCDVGGEDTADEIVKTVNLENEYSGVAVNPTNLGNSTETANERAHFNPNGTAATGSVTNSKDSRVQTLCMNSSTGNIRVVNCSTCTDPNCS